MTSRKRSSLRRLSSRARSQLKLLRNGLTPSTMAVAAGVGIVAYLLWKKSQAVKAAVAALSVPVTSVNAASAPVREQAALPTSGFGYIGGFDPSDQGQIDDQMNAMEAKALIGEPSQSSTSSSTSSTPSGRGYAGGVFAKNLFSGMSGG